MRVVAIADTHGFHRHIDVPDGDVLLHAGDFDVTWEKEANHTGDFMQWFADQPHPFKAVCPGNHEKDLHGERLQSLLPQGVHFLADTGATFMGHQFWGTPWRSANSPGGPKSSTVSPIQEGTDILLSHCPPFGILDKLPDRYDRMGRNIGCQDILQQVQAIKPKLHIFGHVHCNHGSKKIADTLFVNASLCDFFGDRYKPTNRPIVVDI